MGSVYVPPAAGTGPNYVPEDATRSIQYNYLRTYMGAHMLSWPSYRYIYLQTIIFALAFLVIGIIHHFQVHDRTVIGVKWSKWSTKNRVIKLGSKDDRSEDSSPHPPPTQPARIDAGAQQTAFSYPPSAVAAARTRINALDRSTIHSDEYQTDDDHASIEGAHGPSLFTRIANLPRYLFKPSFRAQQSQKRQLLRERRQQQDAHNRKRKTIEFPSFGRIIVLFFVTAVPVILSMVGADYINPNSAVFDFRSSWVSSNNAFLYSIGGIAKRQPLEWGLGRYPSITTNPAGVTLPYHDWWTAGDRMGDFAFALTPLVLLVALKQVPWALLSTKWMGGLAFDKLSFLHQWVGRLIWIFATAHVAAWSVQLGKDEQYAQSMWNFVFWWVKFRWGIVSYIFLTLLMFLSLSPFRMDTYEWFYVAHVVCAFMFMLTAAIHHPPLWPWMGAPLILWAFERGHRALKVMWINNVGFTSRKMRAPQIQHQQASEYRNGAPPGFSFTQEQERQQHEAFVPSQSQRPFGFEQSSYYEKGSHWGSINSAHSQRARADLMSSPNPQQQQQRSQRSAHNAKDPSVVTTSSLMSESTYVDSSSAAITNANMNRMHVGGHPEGAFSSSSSNSTPVNSPPMMGRRVVGPDGDQRGIGSMMTEDAGNGMAEMYNYNGNGSGSYPSNTKAGYPRSDLQIYPVAAETDLADGGGGGGGGGTPDSETAPVTMGVVNQSQVHLLAPGPHTPGGKLSPNPSVHDWRGPSPAFGLGQPGAQARARARVQGQARPALAANVLSMLKPGFAFAEVLPGQTVRLTLRTPHSLTWRPGQYVNLNVPSVAWWQSHPFTIASASDSVDDLGEYARRQFRRISGYGTKEVVKKSEREGEREEEEDRTMVLIIRARQGFTLSLWEHICRVRYQQIERAMQAGSLAHVPQKHQTGVQIRAIVDGPYGSTGRIHWGAHSTVMIICGGSGVSFGLSVLEHLCAAMVEHAELERSMGENGGMPPTSSSSKRKGHDDDRRAFLTRRIRFVWILREFVHLQWAASALRRCIQMVRPEQLQVDIFVTHLNDQSHYERGGAGAGAGAFVSAAQHGEMQAKMGSSMGGKGGGGYDDSSLNVPPHTPGFAPSTMAGSTPSLPGTSNQHMPSQSYAERAARFTEGPEQDEYEVSAADLTNFEGEAEMGLSKAEMEMNMAVQKEGKLRRANTRKMSMRVRGGARGGGAGRGGRGQGAAGGGGLGRVQGSRDESSALEGGGGGGGFLSAAEMAAFSEVHGGAPVSDSKPLRPAFRPDARGAGGAGTNVNGGFGRQPAAIGAGAGGDPEDLAETAIDLDEQEDEDMRVVAELARPGHPKLDKIVGEECEHSLGRVMISSCGPASLGTVLRSIATKRMDPEKVKRGDLRGQVNVVTESFDWGGS
ncbi:unnamed protein product [Tilletia controversa]|uniref:ferric-chelate reductase (NADPH) n=1 Tax=Tilletia controversa TaxID=13291 RepID=A0A8X7SYI2_9BASI|nr:hypothetical protein CF328_g2905 [Tilletia controversa]KAE8251377.1 hypothetical protein A4X06_0g2707 [Tilletia controversa]CAD6919180.1 unnamed protein product [Tilletia controversa]CAD6921625.1 unnamed protein product [Tilletia controversa]CAD6967651.1 unnamed protein product [Tilletia controversa]